MSIVTLRDKQRLLMLLGSGTQRRDETILSLARKDSWTEPQRVLAEKMIRERPRRLRFEKAAR